MAVIGFLILLLSAWLLFGWYIGESTDTRWLRLCCAPTFVGLAVLISGGAGAGIALVHTKSAFRADVKTLLQVVEQRLQDGQADRVLRELRRLDHTGDPDADAFDILEELPQATARLADDDGVSQLAQAAPATSATR